MNDHTKVFIVTAGSYSDYHIERVYFTEAEAQAYVALKEADDPNSQYREYRVEDWPVGDAGYYVGQVWRARWEVDDCLQHNVDAEWHKTEAGLEGFCGGNETIGRWDVDGPTPPDIEAEHWVYGPPERRRYGAQVEVTGFDKDRVLKALRDRIAQAKAELIELAPPTRRDRDIKYQWFAWEKEKSEVPKVRVIDR